MKLSDLRNKYKQQFLICAVGRDENAYIPDGNFTLQSGDKIGITATPSEAYRLFKEIGALKKQARDVMILGASRTAYYLARMLAGGEEPRFIARRLVILASEDIGLANPNALLLANACFDTVHKIGMPEARITLAETTIYLATSPKSNSAYMAINAALDFVSHDTTNRPVPLHLRNAPTKLMSEAGYGKDYKYAHDYAGGFVNQEFLPESLSGKSFYKPNTQNATEAKIAERMNQLWRDKYK